MHLRASQPCSCVIAWPVRSFYFSHLSPSQLFQNPQPNPNFLVTLFSLSAAPSGGGGSARGGGSDACTAGAADAARLHARRVCAQPGGHVAAEARRRGGRRPRGQACCTPAAAAAATAAAAAAGCRRWQCCWRPACLAPRRGGACRRMAAAGGWRSTGAGDTRSTCCVRREMEHRSGRLARRKQHSVAEAAGSRAASLADPACAGSGSSAPGLRGTCSAATRRHCRQRGQPARLQARDCCGTGVLQSAQQRATAPGSSTHRATQWPHNAASHHRPCPHAAPRACCAGSASGLGLDAAAGVSPLAGSAAPARCSSRWSGERRQAPGCARCRSRRPGGCGRSLAALRAVLSDCPTLFDCSLLSAMTDESTNWEGPTGFLLRNILFSSFFSSLSAPHSPQSRWYHMFNLCIKMENKERRERKREAIAGREGSHKVVREGEASLTKHRAGLLASAIKRDCYRACCASSTLTLRQYGVVEHRA